MNTAQWLNRLVVDMWPYYDKAAGQAIREAVEPMMEQYKPPGLIKRIYFKTLTFGDAPIRIDNVWVEDEGEEHVLMEARPLPCILFPLERKLVIAWAQCNVLVRIQCAQREQWAPSPGEAPVSTIPSVCRCVSVCAW